jgi:hypothetical protein
MLRFGLPGEKALSRVMMVLNQPALKQAATEQRVLAEPILIDEQALIGEQIS